MAIFVCQRNNDKGYTMINVKYILSEIGQCAGIDGCQYAPKVITESLPIVKENVAYTITAQNKNRGLDATPHSIDFSERLCDAVAHVHETGAFPIILGGDHSSGIGTISGIAKSINFKTGEDLGLLWIDAHFDLHTPDTSDSGNLHGMSASTVLGHGLPELVNIGMQGAKIKPENMAFIGIRSFETPEQQLAEKMGVKVFYADDVNTYGFISCFKQIIDMFQSKNIPFAISFDMDSLDISEMTALGTPVENGLVLADIMDGFKNTDLSGLQAVEIVEYNPTLDKTGTDIIPVQKIMSCFDDNIVDMETNIVTRKA